MNRNATRPSIVVFTMLKPLLPPDFLITALSVLNNTVNGVPTVIPWFVHHFMVATELWDGPSNWIFLPSPSPPDTLGGLKSLSPLSSLQSLSDAICHKPCNVTAANIIGEADPYIRGYPRNNLPFFTDLAKTRGVISIYVTLAQIFGTAGQILR